MKCYLFAFFAENLSGYRGFGFFVIRLVNFEVGNDKFKEEAMKMLLGGKPSNYYIPITIQKLAVYTVSLPLFGFFFCIITSFIYNFEVHICF